MYTFSREPIDRSKGKVNDKLTPKENYLRAITGGDIEYLPYHSFFGPALYEEQSIWNLGTSSMLYRSDFYPGADKFHDDWGVEYTSVPSANGSFIPSGTHTGDYLIKDIYHWDKYIWKPELYDDIDWKKKAEEDLKTVDRNRTCVICGSPLMPFQQMMAMLGFNDGLEIMLEEPELFAEVEDYMVSYLMPHIEANVEYYQPDVFIILDDTAAQRSPFISLSMFREQLLPVYKRICKPATDRGIPLAYHNCGHCDVFLPDMIDMGVRLWDPAQTVNDLAKLQATYGKTHSFNIVGGFEWHEPDNWPNPDEEYVRQQMRDSIDRLAPGGHCMPSGAIIGPGGDPLTKKVNGWLGDESYFYRREWMRKNG